MLVATAVIAGLGLVSGLGLSLAARFFAVEVDPRQEEIVDLMPGANCGGCGLAGCGDFARAVVAGSMAPDGCPVGGSEVARAVAAVMGIGFEEKERRVALIHCQGTGDVAGLKFRYNGLASCASAALLGGGDKLCGYGCLGLGDCQEACGFGAIEMTTGGIAHVIPERCTACGQCVAACPKDLVELVPASAPIHVLCGSRDKGGVARKACSLACIGCKKCEKFHAEGQVVVEDFLARVDYENPPADAAELEECPSGAIVEVHLGGKGSVH